MANNPPVVGFRFRPTDEELVEEYLRRKNLKRDTTRVDRVFNTLNISNFDPWELPSQSILKSRDQVWYFFGRKENKYNSGDRQVRKTKKGFWKKTGKTMDIKRKRGNREKIGEKRVLVFHFNGLKTKWVMHEYHATFSSPDQMMMTYTICKLKFKGEESEIHSPPSVESEHNHSSITQVNNSGGLSTGSEVGTLLQCPQSQELDNSLQSSGFLNVFKEIQPADTMRKAISSMSSDEWDSLLNDDDYKKRKTMCMQEDRNDYIPKKPLTGVYNGHSSDDSDSESISEVTGSIETLSTFDSFGSLNHRVDQNIELQESPNSIIKLPPKVNKTLGQETNIGESKLGQKKTKNKRAGFFYRIIKRFIKKIQLCTSI